jgi:hypothetical protein
MSHQDDIRQLITNNSRRLQKLKEQKALFGIDTPPHILLEIENIEAEMANLQMKLEELEILGQDALGSVIGSKERVVVGNPQSEHQLRQQRKWQRIDEIHKIAIRFVEGAQKTMLKMGNIIRMSRNERLLTQSVSFDILSGLTEESNQSVLDMSKASVLEDAELSTLYQEVIDTFEYLVGALTANYSSSSPEKDAQSLIYETVIKVSVIRNQIDARFEQLKSEIL